MFGFYAQFTPDQIRDQYKKNVQSLREMVAKAEVHRRQTCNGYSLKALQAKVVTYETLSQLSDADLKAHFDKTHTVITTRLQVLKAKRQDRVVQDVVDAANASGETNADVVAQDLVHAMEALEGGRR